MEQNAEHMVVTYGVYQINSAEAERCVLDAISVGYRSIDTAQAYGNEDGVGNAIVNAAFLVMSCSSLRKYG